ncbi:MAG: MAC/perforin domain-containing protein, partial [Verrucomicrobiota bacterium]
MNIRTKWQMNLFALGGLCLVAPFGAYCETPVEQRAQDTLGYGYDAMSNQFGYADRLAVKSAKIFDVSPEHRMVTSYLETKTNIIKTFGKTASEYSQNLAAGLEIGVSYGAFSGEVSSKIGGANSTAKDRALFTQMDKRVVAFAVLRMKEQKVYSYRSSWGFYPPPSVSLENSFVPEAPVNPAFLKDVEAAFRDGGGAKSIIDKYGTHYITGLTFGGRMDITRTESSSVETNRNSMSLAVEASYGVVSGKATLDKSSSESNSRSDSETLLTFNGGELVGLNAENYFDQASKGDGSLYN